MVAQIWDRFEAIEECYEFMLAYAAQGLATEEASESGRQVRKFLNRAVEALDGLGATCATASGDKGDKLHAFLAVLDRDARDSLAAMELVLAQPAISSQLIDNLNASMHLRALLTDVFLLGEVLRTKRAAESYTAVVPRTLRKRTCGCRRNGQKAPTRIARCAPAEIPRRLSDGSDGSGQTSMSPRIAARQLAIAIESFVYYGKE